MLELLAIIVGLGLSIRFFIWLLEDSSMCNNYYLCCLHYKFTTALLLFFGLLVAFKQYIGNPIDCFVDGDKDKNKVMDTYCWNQWTFTVPSRAFGKKIGEQIPHPGVALPEEGDELKYYAYYQWMCFMLFFQAMLFCLPHYLWKVWGAKYFKANFFRASCCEMFNFVNVASQICLMNLFIGYEFTTYGPRVVQYANMDPEDRPDPMALVFPKITTCTFRGASGQCMLSINDLNEKIYVILGFWFIMVAVVTGLVLLCRLALLLFPQMQLMMRARLAP